MAKISAVSLARMLKKAEQKEEVLKHVRVGMDIFAAAALVGVTRKQIEHWVNRDDWDKELQAAYALRKQRLLQELDEHIFIKKDFNALKFELKAKIPEMYKEDTTASTNNLFVQTNVNSAFDERAAVRVLEEAEAVKEIEGQKVVE